MVGFWPGLVENTPLVSGVLVCLGSPLRCHTVVHVLSLSHCKTISVLSKPLLTEWARVTCRMRQLAVCESIL